MNGVLVLYQSLRSARHLVMLSVFGYSSVCKHNPSCSEYARQQIAQHGTIWGSVKAIVRIAHCW